MGSSWGCCVAQEAQGGWEGLLCYTNEIRRGPRGLEKGDVGGLDQKESGMQWASGQRKGENREP